MCLSAASHVPGWSRAFPPPPNPQKQDTAKAPGRQGITSGPSKHQDTTGRQQESHPLDRAQYSPSSWSTFRRPSAAATLYASASVGKLNTAVWKYSIVPPWLITTCQDVARVNNKRGTKATLVGPGYHWVESAPCTKPLNCGKGLYGAGETQSKGPQRSRVHKRTDKNLSIRDATYVRARPPVSLAPCGAANVSGRQERRGETRKQDTCHIVAGPARLPKRPHIF